jgi:hypothetical protein
MKDISSGLVVLEYISPCSHTGEGSALRYTVVWPIRRHIVVLIRRSSARRDCRGSGMGIGLGRGGILTSKPNLSGKLKELDLSHNLLLMEGRESSAPEGFITLATPPLVAFLYIGPAPQRIGSESSPSDDEESESRTRFLQRNRLGRTRFLRSLAILQRLWPANFVLDLHSHRCGMPIWIRSGNHIRWPHYCSSLLWYRGQYPAWFGSGNYLRPFPPRRKRYLSRNLHTLREQRSASCAHHRRIYRTEPLLALVLVRAWNHSSRLLCMLVPGIPRNALLAHGGHLVEKTKRLLIPLGPPASRKDPGSPDSATAFPPAIYHDSILGGVTPRHLLDDSKHIWEHAVRRDGL